MNPTFSNLLSSLGLLSGTPEIFDDIVQNLLKTTTPSSLLLLNLHNTLQGLFELGGVPTLVTAGTKDLLT